MNVTKKDTKILNPHVLNYIDTLEQKRGTLRGIWISRPAKIPTLYRDWLRSLN